MDPGPAGLTTAPRPRRAVPRLQRERGMITFAPGNLRVPKWTRPVYMVAAGTTDYRKRYPEKRLEELCMMAFRMLLEENDLRLDPLEVKGLVNFASYGEFADHFQDQLLCEAKVHDYLGLDPLPTSASRPAAPRAAPRCSSAPRRWRADSPTAPWSSAGSGWTR